MLTFMSIFPNLRKVSASPATDDTHVAYIVTSVKWNGSQGTLIFLFRNYSETEKYKPFPPS